LFPEQLQYVANHAEDQVVVVDESLVPAFMQHLSRLKTVRHVIVNGDATSLDAPAGIQVHTWQELLAAEPDEFDYPIVDERSAAAMCYTSGTTGDPKGVVYTHRSNWLHAMQLINRDGMGFTSEDTVLAIVPLFHANGWGIPYAAMMNGANVLMPDRFLQPDPLLRLMESQKPTYGAAVPTIWSGVLAQLEGTGQDISYLKTVIVGGAALSPAMMHAFEEKHGVRLLHAWGMTGTSGDEAWRYRYTQGRFPAGVQARLVGDDGAILPHDGIALGELEVRGPWITGSYYAPAGNLVDPEKFRDGWLRTGDIGRISPDGYLTLVDRTKDVIKSGGEWISSVDLENAVMSHPAVVEAAVIGVPDPKWGERPLVAVVTPPGAEVTSEELRKFLGRQFAKWQLPEHWAFISEVPKTGVGKFDKKRLRAMHAQGALGSGTTG
jgi:fatty-acyl-CoA synthase